MALSFLGDPGALLQAAGSPVARAAAAVGYAERMAAKGETLLDETIETMRAARTLVDAVSRAVDDGLLDDARSSLHRLDETAEMVGRVSERIDRTLPVLDTTVQHIGSTLPIVDRTARAVHATVPIVSSLPTTQDDVRLAREAVERLVGLLDAVLVQLDSLPGARLVRRRITRTGPDESATLPS